MCQNVFSKNNMHQNVFIENNAHQNVVNKIAYTKMSLGKLTCTKRLLII